MNNQRVKVIAAAALSLLIGFAGGLASKEYFDKPNSARANDAATSANIPVHKLQTATVTTNQMIAPNLWSVFLDPLFVPVNLDINPLALPNFISVPMDVPSVKTVDGSHELQIVAQVPGLTEKDVDVQVGRDLVTIRGERKEEKRADKSFATVSQSFVRTVQLPCNVDGDKVKATLKNGILTVSLPKKESITDNK